MDSWIEIFASLSKNWLRTILSGFTVSLGLFIFITLFGMGNGLQNSFQQEFIKGSANAIFIDAGETSIAYEGLQANRKIQFKNEDLDYLKKYFSDKIQYFTAAMYDNVKASYKAEFGAYTVRAVHPAREIIEMNQLIKGRFLSEEDIQNREKNIVIGRLVEQDLFAPENSIDKFLNLNGFNYKVVGVFSDEGGDNEERIIYVPITTYQQVKSSTQNIDQIVLGYNPKIPAGEMILVGENIKTSMKRKFMVSPEDQSAIYVSNDAEDQAGAQGFVFVLSIIIGIIGFGTLVAGMMGIFNIMVYSVQERTKELGIRKAIGAKPNDIIKLILYESIVVTFVSGIVGILAGVLFLQSIGDALEEFFIYDPAVGVGLIIFALVCLVLAGVVAGLIPSYRASKIKPIEALRSE